MSFGTFQFEFATLQSQTRLYGRSVHSHVCSKVSVTARTFSRQVNLYTSQSVRENQRTQAFCAYATFIHEAPGFQALSGPLFCVLLFDLLSSFWLLLPTVAIYPSCRLSDAKRNRKTSFRSTWSSELHLVTKNSNNRYHAYLPRGNVPVGYLVYATLDKSVR